MDFCNNIGTTLCILGKKTQWENRAKLYVGLMKNAVRKDIQLTGSPLVLWDYAEERCATILSLTMRDLFQLQGSNPYTATIGEEGDISNLCQFGWYEWVYFYDNSSIIQFPFPKAILGRCLGPDKNEGNEMTQWILKQNGGVVPRRTVRKLTSEMFAPSNDVKKEKRYDFDIDIRKKLGNYFSFPVDTLQPENLKEDPTYDYYGKEPFMED